MQNISLYLWFKLLHLAKNLSNADTPNARANDINDHTKDPAWLIMFPNHNEKWHE